MLYEPNVLTSRQPHLFMKWNASPGNRFLSLRHRSPLHHSPVERRYGLDAAGISTEKWRGGRPTIGRTTDHLSPSCVSRGLQGMVQISVPRPRGSRLSHIGGVSGMHNLV